MSRDFVERPADSEDRVTVDQPAVSEDQGSSGEPAVSNNRRRRRVIVRRVSTRSAVSALPAGARNLLAEVIEISSEDETSDA